MTLVYFLVFTVVSSAVAYHIVVKAYDAFGDTNGLTYENSTK